MADPIAAATTARAQARYARIAPRKARRIIDLVRGMKASEALDILRFAPQAASEDIYKVVASAVANAEHNEHLDRDALWISEAYVDEGPAAFNAHLGVDTASPGQVQVCGDSVEDAVDGPPVLALVLDGDLDSVAVARLPVLNFLDLGRNAVGGEQLHPLVSSGVTLGLGAGLHLRLAHRLPRPVGTFGLGLLRLRVAGEPGE